MNEEELAEIITKDIVDTISQTFGGAVVSHYGRGDIGLWFKGFEIGENGDIFFHNDFIANYADPECVPKIIVHLKSFGFLSPDK